MKFKRKSLTVDALVLTKEFSEAWGTSFNGAPQYLVTYEDGRQEVIASEVFGRDFDPVGRKPTSNWSDRKPTKPGKSKGRKALGKGLKEEVVAPVGVAIEGPDNSSAS